MVREPEKWVYEARKSLLTEVIDRITQDDWSEEISIESNKNNNKYRTKPEAILVKKVNDPAEKRVEVTGLKKTKREDFLVTVKKGSKSRFPKENDLWESTSS